MDIISDELDINNLVNIGIKSYGCHNVINIINEFYSNYDVPIVSIGSGAGAIEFLSKKQNNNIEWICIDINENPIDFPSKASNYINKPLMKIDYLSIDELIEKNNTIVNNCIIFLNWCLPNDSYYDYEAIIKLKPLAILSIYEDFDGKSGAAGGEMFYHWINTNTDYHLKQDNYLYKDYTNNYNKFEDEYDKKKFEDEYDDYELMDIRIKWWESNKFDIKDTIQKRFPCLYSGNRKKACCIQ